MKFIGQYIQSFIARFRSDVYLEDIDAGTIASGGNLGLDSNNKIVKGTAPLGTLTTLTVDEITIDGDTITASDDLNIVATGNDITVDTDNFTIESETGVKPTFTLKATVNSNKPANLAFVKDKGAAGANGDFIGDTYYVSDNDAQEQIMMAMVSGKVSDATDGAEEGEYIISVKNTSSPTAPRPSLTLTGAGGVTNATIGYGVSSRINIAGVLAMNGTDTINNSGVIQVAAQTVIDHDQLANFAANEHYTQANITTVGTIGTGVWNGDVIGTAYTEAKVTSVVAGDGINVSGATGDVTVTAETATDSNPGIVELATDGETALVTDSTKAVTPASLGVALTAHTLGRVSQIINLKGYVVLQDDVYDIANPFSSDDEAPFQMDTSYGSGTIGSGTEVTQSKFFRAGSFHVPFACTVSALQVQATVNGSGDGNIIAALVEYRPSDASGDQNDYPRTVYEEVSVASNNSNSKVATTTISAGNLDATAIPAGSHLMIMVKGDSDTAGDTAVVSMAIGLSW